MPDVHVHGFVTLPQATVFRGHPIGALRTLCWSVAAAIQIDGALLPENRAAALPDGNPSTDRMPICLGILSPWRLCSVAAGSVSDQSPRNAVRSWLCRGSGLCDPLTKLLILTRAIGSVTGRMLPTTSGRSTFLGSRYDRLQVDRRGTFRNHSSSNSPCSIGCRQPQHASAITHFWGPRKASVQNA